MEIRWSEPHRVAVIDPRGDLGIRSMVSIKNAVGTLLQDGCRTVIVDCQGVERVEAMGLGVLVERMCRAREQGGTLVLARVGPTLAARMRDLRVDSLLAAFDSIQAALNATVGVQAGAAEALAA